VVSPCISHSEYIYLKYFCSILQKNDSITVLDWLKAASIIDRVSFVFLLSRLVITHLLMFEVMNV